MIRRLPEQVFPMLLLALLAGLALGCGDSAPDDAATAAVDAFCGGLADAFSRGENLRKATEWATRVAALAVQRHGAQESLPRLSELR